MVVVDLLLQSDEVNKCRSVAAGGTLVDRAVSSVVDEVDLDLRVGRSELYSSAPSSVASAPISGARLVHHCCVDEIGLRRR
jgi:hypothetical protein